MTQHYRNFSAPEAARLAGITYRQLDHAIRIGCLVPEVEAAGSGTRRKLSFHDVLLLRAAKILGDELEIPVPRALELIPPQADLEGEVEVKPSPRITVRVDLHLEPAEWWELEMAA